jgi:hypothetical protein
MTRFIARIVVAALLLTSVTARADKYWHPRNFGTAARKAIMKDLYKNPISGANTYGGQDHVHTLYKGWLHKAHNRAVGRGVFVKEHNPALIFGNGTSFDNPVGEAVAHKLDVMLRGSYVPPAANRRWVQCSGRTTDYATVVVEAGKAKSSWAQDVSRARPHNTELAASDIAVRGVLLGNKDIMHNPNILLAKHWVDGRKSVVAIDWAGIFKADQRLEHGAAIRRQPVRRFNRATYQALKKLTYDNIKLEMRDSTLPQGWLANWQIHRILNARDGIVRYIDQQVQQRGANDVFFRKPNGSWDVGPYGWLD